MYLYIVQNENVMQMILKYWMNIYYQFKMDAYYVLEIIYSMQCNTKAIFANP